MHRSKITLTFIPLLLTILLLLARPVVSAPFPTEVPQSQTTPAIDIEPVSFKKKGGISIGGGDDDSAAGRVGPGMALVAMAVVVGLFA
ncbi:hypothetical protein HK097_008070 [Rhizophlyctis rosea]|uniref:Uncharacterized protein n=1 Tax=Rhizophlyctis rosea TaxID=64517 RepID=A0AAD5SAQ8_9FUNG|nr:hypothetical protein HK097_008070 [Rhizophlyctis rosea]